MTIVSVLGNPREKGNSTTIANRFRTTAVGTPAEVESREDVMMLAENAAEKLCGGDTETGKCLRNTLRNQPWIE